MKKLLFKCTAAVKQDDGTTLVNLISVDGKQIKASSVVFRFDEGDERAKKFVGESLPETKGSEHYVTVSED